MMELLLNLAQSFNPSISSCKLDNLRTLPEDTRQRMISAELRELAETINSTEGGVPATYSIGSDRYACTAVRASASGKTITVEMSHDRVRTFRWYDARGFRGKGGIGSLYVGEAETYLDPSF